MRCELCGINTGTLGYRTIDGVQKKCCLICMDTLDNKEMVTLDLPQNIVFIGKVAKMGPQRHFNIPINQRDFLKDNKKYIIIVKDPAKKED